MISKTDQYALRAVLYLAQNPERPVRAAQVAGALRLPANYLSKILHTLARVGLLASERGPQGGFRLARPAAEISLAEIIQPFDTTASERSCLFGRPECSDESPCRVHHHWKQASDPVIDFFQDTRISDLLDEGDR